MDERTTELEMKVAWLENSLSELDAVVRGLGDELTHLRREVADLRGARASAAAEGAREAEPAESAEESLRYERPPHY